MARDSAVLEEPGAAALASEQAYEHAQASSIEAIGLSLIVESKDNPRKHFPDAWIAELAASLRASGQHTPCLVRPHPTEIGKYELAAGATRYRAARAAGITTLVCVVRPMDDAQFLEVLTFENLKRRDLQPMEEARGYATLQKKLEGWTVERIAEKSGVSPDYVRDRLRLLRLCPEAQELLEANTITLGHALELAKIPSEKQREVVVLSSRQVGALWAATQQRTTDQLNLRGEDPLRGLAVRSVRELREWIDRNVRVDLAHPELEHLLPDTAQRLAAAQVEQRKQVFISFGYVDPHVKGKEKVVGPLSWKKAESEGGAATCEHAVLGIVFAGDAARGHAFLVCTAKEKCKRHWPQHVKKREERAKAARGELTDKKGGKVSEAAVVQKQREQEAREQAAREARRKALAAAAPEVLDALFAAAKKANPVSLVRQLGFDFQNAQVKKRASALPTKTAEDLLRLVFLEASLGRVWNITEEWAFDRDFKPMAKVLGVNLDAIVKKHAPPPPKVEPAKPAAPKVPAAVQKKHARVVAKAKATGKPVKVNPNRAFMKPVTPDAVLAAVVGAKPLTRVDLTKKLWAYITKHGLQDKKNKRTINADEKLKALFGGKVQVSMFDMTKIVSKHLVQGQAA